jgi:hypothetical protein
LNSSSRSGFSIGSFEILASLSAEFRLLKEPRIAQNFVLSRFIHFASLRLQAIASDIGSGYSYPRSIPCLPASCSPSCGGGFYSALANFNRPKISKAAIRRWPHFKAAATIRGLPDALKTTCTLLVALRPALKASAVAALNVTPLSNRTQTSPTARRS